MLGKELLIKTIRRLSKTLKENRELTNFDLIKICEDHGINLIGQNKDLHFLHELLEVAVNFYITEKYQSNSLKDEFVCKLIFRNLIKLEKGLPPQSWRSREQLLFQQFSTPPTIAFLMMKILNPSQDEAILEPSAGTGSLATWLKLSGCRIYLNELAERRRELLELQGFKPTAFNAEFLNDLLPDEIKPDGVLMNPPFSSTGGRTKIKDSNFGFRHLQSALSRLKQGGKMVALLGTESGTKTDKAKGFWKRIAVENEIKAFIHLPQQAFYKYGTSIATSIICLRKNEAVDGKFVTERRQNPLEVSCQTLDDGLNYTNIFED